MNVRASRSLLLTALLSSCSQNLPLGTNKAGLTLAQPTTTVIVAQDGYPTQLGVALTGDAVGHTTLFFTPSTDTFGVTNTPVHDTGSPTAQITLKAATTSAPPGDYPLTLTATNQVTGVSSPPFALTLRVAIEATVSNSPDTTLGLDGGLAEVVSTSVQPATFQTFIPDVDAMAALNPQHVHVQIYQAPWTSQTGDSEDWSFTMLDQFVATLLNVGDGQPELQIMQPPTIATLTTPGDIATFADYCANLVSYYNVGSFPYGDAQTIRNTNFDPQHKVHNWGILSDFNTMNLSAAQYMAIYNQAVLEMTAIDSKIEISALEVSDNPTGTSQFRPSSYLQSLILPADDGGASQRVDSVALHMFATNLGGQDTSATDTNLFQTVQPLASDVKAVRTLLGTTKNLADTPVWVTQANIDSDYPVDGQSHANSSSAFVNDARGTHTFFAAWAPYMFSRLGQSGNSAFYHWVYTSGHDPGDASLDLDIQNAEVNYDDQHKFLSYWVDKALSDAFPRASMPVILGATTTEPSNSPTVDVLVTRRPDGTVVVMMSDIAVDPARDLNGNGLPRTVVVDLSSAATPSFSASLLTVDSDTDAAVGPASAPLTLPQNMRVPMTLPGYGVAFLTLTPPPPP